MAKESRIPFVDGKRGSFIDYLVLSSFIAVGLVFFHLSVAKYVAEHGPPRNGRVAAALLWLDRHTYGSKTYLRITSGLQRNSQ
ncbi:hypothetical protein [Singulisphaera sp. PoT]|uniref:hypothetical protein n=1 Tax=Singulisphaera sp. PoT TaxID=3411797 RepID=UPI003BF47E24